MCQHPNDHDPINAKNWRRFEREQSLDPFANRGAGSWFPGYEAEELDDGRLEPRAVVRNGFVPVGELPDTSVPYEEEDEPIALIEPPHAPRTYLAERTIESSPGIRIIIRTAA